MGLVSYLGKLGMMADDGRTIILADGSGLVRDPAALVCQLMSPGVGQFGVICVPKPDKENAQHADLHRRICLVIPSQDSPDAPLNLYLTSLIRKTIGPPECLGTVTVVSNGGVHVLPRSWVVYLDDKHRPLQLEICPHAPELSRIPSWDEYYTSDWNGADKRENETQPERTMWQHVGNEGVIFDEPVMFADDDRVATSTTMESFGIGKPLEAAAEALAIIQMGFQVRFNGVHYNWRFLDQKVWAGNFRSWTASGDPISMALESPPPPPKVAAPVIPNPELKMKDGKPYPLSKGVFVIPQATEEYWAGPEYNNAHVWNSRQMIHAFKDVVNGAYTKVVFTNGITMDISCLRPPEWEPLCEVVYSLGYTNAQKTADRKAVMENGLMTDLGYSPNFYWTGLEKTLKDGTVVKQIAYITGPGRRVFYAPARAFDVTGFWSPITDTVFVGDKVRVIPAKNDPAGIKVAYGKTLTVSRLEETLMGTRIAFAEAQFTLPRPRVMLLEMCIKELTPPDKAVSYASPSRDNNFEVTTVDCVVGDAKLRLEDKTSGAKCSVMMKKETLVGLLRSALFVLDPPPPKPKEQPVAVETSQIPPKPVPEEKPAPKARKRPKKDVPKEAV